MKRSLPGYAPVVFWRLKGETQEQREKYLHLSIDITVPRDSEQAQRGH